MTKSMNIAAPVVETAAEKDVRPPDHHPAVIITRADSDGAPRATRRHCQQRGSQANFDSRNREGPIHACLPFGKEMKVRADFRTTIRREVMAQRNIFAAWPTPHTSYAAAIKSPSVSVFLRFIFIPQK
jgi:hypothetical protein